MKTPNKRKVKRVRAIKAWAYIINGELRTYADRYMIYPLESMDKSQEKYCYKRVTISWEDK